LFINNNRGLFVSSIEGLVLRADLLSLLHEEETIVRNLQTIVSPILFPITVPVNALLLSNNNNSKKKGTAVPPSLPSYLKVMFRSSTSESRLTSLVVIPPLPQSTGGGVADSFRVFVVDANKEQLIALKESGGNDIRSYNSIAVGKQFQVYWPFQLLFFSSSSSSATSSSVSFILSEYFGESIPKENNLIIVF
jgi:hypothetical protein